jgi:hypothetical protein
MLRRSQKAQRAVVVALAEAGGLPTYQPKQREQITRSRCRVYRSFVHRPIRLSWARRPLLIEPT